MTTPDQPTDPTPDNGEDDIAQQFKAALNEAIADDIRRELDRIMRGFVRAARRRKAKP